MATTNLTQQNRKRLAGLGVARRDGSYPIADAEDLAAAINDYNRTGQEPAIKEWIIRRARILDLVSKLPASWGVK